jgi:hypothetical protein
MSAHPANMRVKEKTYFAVPSHKLKQTSKGANSAGENKLLDLPACVSGCHGFNAAVARCRRLLFLS